MEIEDRLAVARSVGPLRGGLVRHRQQVGHVTSLGAVKPKAGARHRTVHRDERVVCGLDRGSKTARELLAEAGPECLTMDLLAERSGLGKAPDAAS